MKRILLFILLLMSLAVPAQLMNEPFLEEGKTWTYRYYNDMTQKNFMESLSVHGDTVINNKFYKKICKTDEDGTPLVPFIFVVAMREEDRKVFGLYPNGEECMLYDFGMGKGDTYIVGQHSDGTQEIAKVYDVNSIQIGNRRLRSFKLGLYHFSNEAPKEEWDDDFLAEGGWIEGIGSIFYLTQPFLLPGLNYAFYSCRFANGDVVLSKDVYNICNRVITNKLLKEGKSWNYTYTYREIDNEGNLIMKTVDYREWIEGTEVRNGQTYFLLHNSENSNTVVLCREDGGRMYALYDKASEEQQVYDFNLDAGSNIDWGFPGFYVSSTDSIEVDGICRKRLYINHATEDYTTGVCVWVEGVGNTGQLLEPFGHPFSDGKQYTLLSCYEGENCIFEAEDFDAVSNGGSNGVKSVKKDSPLKSSAFYDLQGRRLTQKPEKGVYIENGKKVVVK